MLHVSGIQLSLGKMFDQASVRFLDRAMVASTSGPSSSLLFALLVATAHDGQACHTARVPGNVWSTRPLPWAQALNMQMCHSAGWGVHRNV